MSKAIKEMKKDRELMKKIDKTVDGYFGYTDKFLCTKCQTFHPFIDPRDSAKVDLKDNIKLLIRTVIKSELSTREPVEEVMNVIIDMVAERERGMKFMKLPEVQVEIENFKKEVRKRLSKLSEKGK